MAFAPNKEATVKNCVNYGSVTYSGAASNARIGGIVGYSEGGNSSTKYIQNCLNYGTITTAYALRVGGILGHAYSGTNSIENCVSGGKITSNKGGDSVGSIVGYINSEATASITHCYWTVMLAVNMLVEVEDQQLTMKQSKLSSTQQQ